MDAIENILNGEASPNKVFSECDAVPQFLNFIREQCNWLTGTSYADVLTIKYVAHELNISKSSVRESIEKYAGHNFAVVQDTSLHVKSYKDDSKCARKSDLHGSRRTSNKHMGWKPSIKNTGNKKYVKLIEIPQSNQAIPNITDHNEFPLISEATSRGIKKSSVLEKKLKESATLKDCNCAVKKIESFETVQCHIINNRMPRLKYNQSGNGKTMNENCATGNQTRNGKIMNENCATGNQTRNGKIMNENCATGNQTRNGKTMDENCAIGNQARNGKTMNENYNVYDDTKSNQEEITDVDNFIMPSFHLVTDKEKLDCLVNLYCWLIENSLIPNISVELYFLFSLLTARVNSGKDKKTDGTLLKSIHNCVYFATAVLYKQRNLLEVLDRTTLHTLCEMPYLQEFSDLKLELYSVYKKKSTVSRYRKSSIQGVSFQVDTDNRRNFPNDNTFQTFRKQRDLFYELLRDWKEQHFSSSWSSRGNFVGRVKHIIKLSSSSTNFVHLARLIQSQLITACDNEGFAESCNTGDEEIAALKRSFPDKFEKLQERFHVPLKGRGPCPPPSFHGSQEILHDFLEAASSVSLNQHLVDSISAKIVELNQLEFSVYDCKMDVDEILREKFFCCLHSLRILAKFLGYLVFMPYQNSESLSADIINRQCVVRNTCQPPLNVHCLLLDAMKSNRLILTVPWIVEYLSMMDPVAQYLDYYRDIFPLLFKIYRSEPNKVICCKPMNKHFLKLVLGWLFETPNFPISAFFLEVIDAVTLPENNEISAVGYLDALEIIDENIIYSCCPYLAECRAMLEEYLIGIRRKGQEVRKINPVSADNEEHFCIAHLENKLEDNFFYLQSPSIKKTVEFVSERISSKAIHHIRNEIIPATKENSLINIKSVIGTVEENQDSIDINGKISSTINENANKICCEMKSKAVEFAKSFCGNQVKSVMPLLLQDDIAPEVIQTCCDISDRISFGKVLHWIKTYITINYVSVDMRTEIEKFHKMKSIPKGNLFALHSTVLATDFINSLRDKVKELYHDGNVSTSDILKLLSEIRSFLSNKDLLPTAVKIVGSLTVDYSIFLLTYKPNFFTEEVLTAFNSLWCEVLPQCSEVSNLLSIRNISFILCSHDTKSSWYFLRHLLMKLLQNNRITARELETNCMKIMKQEWSEDVMYNFSSFLKELLCWYKVQSTELEFVEVMEWLSWFCEPT